MPPDEPCVHCGERGLQLRKVTRSFGKADALLVIEDIPMISCPHCGESWFVAQTMHEIERITRLRKSLAVKRPVAVAVFLAPA
jgi:YgiT-type zinc finger domain-containing protein